METNKAPSFFYTFQCPHCNSLIEISELLDNIFCKECGLEIFIAISGDFVEQEKKEDTNTENLNEAI